MRTRVLYTDGKGAFVETGWNKPEPTDTEIEVRAIMTGVCRSDIAMMVGEFGPLPLEMSGHEGLGRVTKVGDKIKNVNVGDYVATRGEPAYSDYYNVREREFVVVPEAHPHYILEPVACGLNIITQARSELEAKANKKSRLLIIGSGFLAWVAYTELKNRDYWNFDIDVVGRSNKHLWGDILQNAPDGEYDVVIDLGSGTDVFDKPILKNEALVIFGVQKTVTTDFNNLLWKACKIVFPSPRTEDFYYSMVHAANLIQSGKLNVDSFWTRAYNRDTEWQEAFSDGLNRSNNYGRGYIVW